MVGEIRDPETAKIAVQAALTGHLLLSSLHTNDAPGAIPRLVDLGIPAYLVASVINIVLAQRLVRKICTGCIYSYEITPEIRKTILDQFNEFNVPDAETKIPKILFKGKGCDICGGIGYRGRVGIFEYIENTEEIKNLIIKENLSIQALWREARKNGSETMFEDGIKKVAIGITTIEEVLRVVRE
jgi:type II secretory ATPase GspE/PulE/Tfp pilus assembly ATPase PilB-like protein